MSMNLGNIPQTLKDLDVTLRTIQRLTDGGQAKQMLAEAKKYLDSGQDVWRKIGLKGDIDKLHEQAGLVLTKAKSDARSLVEDAGKQVAAKERNVKAREDAIKQNEDAFAARVEKADVGLKTRETSVTAREESVKLRESAASERAINIENQDAALVVREKELEERRAKLRAAMG